MSQSPEIQAQKPSAIVSAAIFGVSVAVMWWLRIVVYPDRMITLTYGLPLILCLWHRDLRLLWSMAAVFAAMAAYKAFYVLPSANETLTYEFVQWGMHLANLALIGLSIHMVVRLMNRLEFHNRELAAANDLTTRQNRELETQAEELRVQSEELQSQSEEMEQQNEELRQQSEELEQQREEMQQQNEELNALNAELAVRESILLKMLESVHALEGEQPVLDEICRALLSITQGRAVGTGVLEAVDGECVLRARCGFDDPNDRFAVNKSLAGAVMAHDKTAFIEDLRARPDITVPCPESMQVRSILAAPLHLGGKPAGALELYAARPQKWSPEEFALIEWAAAKASLVLEIMRLQVAARTANQQLEARVEERTAELNETVEVLRRRSEQLRALAGELALTEQRERQRLAQVLHDGLQQLLAGARLRLNLLERAKPENAGPMAAEIGELIDEALQTSRSLTSEICPPILREGGLIPALQWLVRWMDTRHHLTVDLDVRDAFQPAEDLTIILFQAVRELLFNVSKHAGVNEAAVRVSRRGDSIEIVVADEGVGFDPAIRADGSESGAYGLFSIRERLDLLGGSFHVESAPGEGSRFTVTAPLPPSAFTSERLTFSEKAIPSAAPPVLASGGEDSAGLIRLMIVDDHLVMLQGLSMLIGEQSDMKIVAQASNGAQAVDLARETRPNIVLMDISMPVMNGIEATQRIHAEFPHVQIIGLSMFEEPDRADAMRAAGAVDYRPKTAPASELVAAIRACIADTPSSDPNASPDPDRQFVN